MKNLKSIQSSLSSSSSKWYPAVIYITTSITTCAVNGSVMRLFFSLPNAPIPACLFLPLCSGTLQMWRHRWQQLAKLVPSVNRVQQLYPAAMNIRAERGMEWPAPDINRGINTLQFNLFHLFLWGLDFAPLCMSQTTEWHVCWIIYGHSQSRLYTKLKCNFLEKLTLWSAKFQLAHQFKNILAHTNWSPCGQWLRYALITLTVLKSMSVYIILLVHII